ncbi:hypothetical protein A8924_5631 [Saccharopolyspora erythraea NRRL 2338]|nr:hypothetical protein A8924_5631 [Saccharopolyspora erythraea NRRL 2338]
MASPGRFDGAPAPNPAMFAAQVQGDDGQAAVQAIEAALCRLDEVGDLPVPEHVERFEAVHTALTDALSKADNPHSGTNGNGS